MDRKNEIKEIDKILKLSQEFQNLDSSTIILSKKIVFVYRNLGKINYLDFIPKTNNYNSKDFLELAIELKSIQNSNLIKNFIYGTSALYFLFILDRYPKYISLRTLGKFIFVGGMIFFKSLENQLIYLRIFNEIYMPELINLKEKLQHENNNWDKYVNID